MQKWNTKHIILQKFHSISSLNKNQCTRYLGIYFLKKPITYTFMNVIFLSLEMSSNSHFFLFLCQKRKKFAYIPFFFSNPIYAKSHLGTKRLAKKVHTIVLTQSSSKQLQPKLLHDQTHLRITTDQTCSRSPSVDWFDFALRSWSEDGIWRGVRLV